ncbi:MAG TPA: hypothetical protein VFG42_16315 [Baekduia sp.]|uniref:hypothetical protein n=1 Tax=Baekduia sp. TaxID=2600305 RepID=UPI002D7838DC|nr:hypothetical protein [Baekduia sp.]HET6508359.1 hypothetical protein [Baekduia sp.]
MSFNGHLRGWLGRAREGRDNPLEGGLAEERLLSARAERRLLEHTLVERRALLVERRALLVLTIVLALVAVVLAVFGLTGATVVSSLVSALAGVRLGRLGKDAG